jgi:hypothetical protein
VPRGEVVVDGSPVLLPVSEAPSGICTLSRGLEPLSSFMLLEREGGVKPRSGIVDTEWRAFE